jgi:hypothetical protein
MADLKTPYEIFLEIGLTQAEAALRLSRPQSFVSNFGSGERRVDLIELQFPSKL